MKLSMSQWVTDTVNGQATGVFYFDGVEKPVREFERGATYTL